MRADRKRKIRRYQPTPQHTNQLERPSIMAPTVGSHVGGWILVWWIQWCVPFFSHACAAKRIQYGIQLAWPLSPWCVDKRGARHQQLICCYIALVLQRTMFACRTRRKQRQYFKRIRRTPCCWCCLPRQYALVSERRGQRLPVPWLHLSQISKPFTH